jgi:tRNA (adenine57-N1/adenine58-N1)-methyltransferase
MTHDDDAPSAGDAMARDAAIAAGDRVLLALEDGNTFLVKMRAGHSQSTHKGAVLHDELIGRPWGIRVETNTGVAMFALRPGWVDRMMKVDRRTNIMYPKDTAWLLATLDLRAGRDVVEIGCGSGAMTIALATAVAPGGRVVSYDRRPEFLELARRNLEAADVGSDVELRTREAGDEIEGPVDAVFCDVPEPWAEVLVAHRALKGAGRFAAATPTFNQAERLAAALNGSGFALVDTVEVLVRSILARPGRTRPAHRMVGHTQLLTSAVKFIEHGSAGG